MKLQKKKRLISVELPNLTWSEVQILSCFYLPVSKFLDINLGRSQLLVAED